MSIKKKAPDWMLAKERRKKKKKCLSLFYRCSIFSNPYFSTSLRTLN